VTGKFYITLGTGKMYGITAVADGYVHYSDNYTVPDTISYRELIHDLPLDPLPNFVTNGNPNANPKPPDNGNPNTNGIQPVGNPQNGGAIELHNIFFDFNKSILRPESRTELRYLIDLLKQHPAARIEIDGHTDSVGTPTYNLHLSQDRANAVRAYLIQNGIAAKRLVAKGFGATQPIASNATEEGRQANRRTEFRFLK
jgi:outer membrane protein OmpA-like peptidoglycan-associated protein